MTTITQTHRSHFADLLPSGGYFLSGIARNGLETDAIDGLDAIAALYFAENEDADTLPDWLVRAYDKVVADFGITSNRFDDALEVE